MDANTARSLLRGFARNAKDTTNYKADQVDFAIQAVIDDYIFHTRRTKCTDVISTVAGSANITITIGDEQEEGQAMNFGPERVVRAWINPASPICGGVLGLIHPDSLLQKLVRCTDQAQPRELAIISAEAAQCFPTADQVYAINIEWVVPLAAFATTANPDLTFIPDDEMRTVLMYGGTALLQHVEPEHKYASDSWKRYIEFRDNRKGIANYGAQTQSRSMIDDAGRGACVTDGYGSLGWPPAPGSGAF